MRLTSKLLSVLVTLFLLASLAACSAPAPTTAPSAPAASTDAATATPAASSEATAPAQLPPLDISALMPHFGGIPEGTPVQKAWQDLMSKDMGRVLNFTWNYVPWGEYADKIKMILASGDLKDLTYLASYDQYNDYFDSDLAVDLSSKMDKCPNYAKFIDETPNGKAQVYTADGKLFGFRVSEIPRLTQGIAMYTPVIYRYDIFEKAGIQIPKTQDDFYAAAKKLKELYPKSFPVSLGASWAGYNMVNYANHVDKGIYWDGKAYQLGAISDAYKDGLVFMHKLYAEKLLDPEFTTDTDDTLKAKALNGTNFIQMAQWFTYAADYTNNKEANVKWVNAIFPDDTKYGQAWQSVSNVNTKSFGPHMLVISTKAKDIDALIQLADLQYTPDVAEMITWGILGESYTKDANGVCKFTDEITKADNPWVAGDKWGQRASSKYRPGLQLCADTKAYIGLSRNDYCYVDGKVTEMPWELAFPNETYPTSPMVPPMVTAPFIQFSADENQTLSTTMTPINTYIDEETTKFITGEESLDNWDKYVAQVKSLGDYESILKLYNDKAAAVQK